MTYREIIRKMMLRGMLCPTVDDERGLFWVSFNELELLEKEFDLKYLEETPEAKGKDFFIDKQGRKQLILSNPLKFTKKD
jgi:hypothetical protein